MDKKIFYGEYTLMHWVELITLTPYSLTPYPIP